MGSEQLLQTLVVRLSMNASQYNRQMMVVQGTTRSMMSSFSNFGSFLTRSVTLPLTVMGAVAVREFGKFDKAMAESLSIMTDVTDEMRGRLEDQARLLGSTTVSSADELAGAYYYLAQTGMSAADAVEALDTVNNFAIAGMFDMGKATDLLTDAQTALGLVIKDNAEANASNMQYLGDVLVKASTLANASVEQFSQALTTKAAAAMRFFNRTTEEGVAVLAAYASQNLKAERGGTMYDRALRLLGKAAINNAEAHKLLGFSVYDADGKMRHMADIVDNLDSLVAGLSDEQRTATLALIGFEARSQQAITPLLGMGDAIRRNEEGLKAASGAMDDVAGKAMNHFIAQLTIMWNRLKVVAIDIGEKVAPAILFLVDCIVDAVEGFNRLPGPIQATAAALAGLAALAGPLAILAGTLVVVHNAILALVGVQWTITVGWMAIAAAVATLYAGLAALAIGFLFFAKNVYDAAKMTDQFNAAIEKAAELQKKWDQMFLQRQNKEMTELQKIVDAKERMVALEEAIVRAKKEQEGAEAQLRGMEAQQKKLAKEEMLQEGDVRLVAGDAAIAEQEGIVEKYAAYVERLENLKDQEEIAAAHREGAEKQMGNVLENMNKAGAHLGKNATALQMQDAMKALTGEGEGSGWMGMLDGLLGKNDKFEKSAKGVTDSWKEMFQWMEKGLVASWEEEQKKTEAAQRAEQRAKEEAANRINQLQQEIERTKLGDALGLVEGAGSFYDTMYDDQFRRSPVEPVTTVEEPEKEPPTLSEIAKTLVASQKIAGGIEKGIKALNTVKGIPFLPFKGFLP